MSGRAEQTQQANADATQLDRAIYCNRRVKMEHIDLIGFDLDHTLLHYNHTELDQLCIDLTLDALVEKKGYPVEIKELSYDLTSAIRGLVVDLNLGHVLKLDRHSRVKRVRHGHQFLPKSEHAKLYRGVRFRQSEERYRWIDTLYEPAEVVIYSALVDYFDQRGNGPSYRQLYLDFLEVLTQKHRQGAIQAVVAKQPDRFVHGAPDLAETLKWIRRAGKTCFILTNSPWNYTNRIMEHLLPKAQHGIPWREHFHFVVVSASKPSFFRETTPFVELNAETGEVKQEEVQCFANGGVYSGGQRQFVRGLDQATGRAGLVRWRPHLRRHHAGQEEAHVANTTRHA